MGGYSMQCDASPAAKVHRGGSHLTKWAQHVARDLDDRAGTPRKHANQDIDRSRTLLNETFVFDDEAGHLVPAESVEQVIASINARVEQHGGLTPSGKKARALTDDSVIVRPLVMSLDPEWVEEHNPDWKENGLNDESKRLHVEMLRYVSEFFGAENVRAASLHLDEETPQWQIALVPMTERGQVSQKEVFSGPTMLKQMHQGLREHMREAGYDASLENVTGDRSRKRFTEKTFKREMRKVNEAQDEADRLMGVVMAREEAVSVREQVARRRMKQAQAKEDAIPEEVARRVEALKEAALKQAHEVEEQARQTLERARVLLEAAEELEPSTERLISGAYRQGVVAGALASARFVAKERRQAQTEAVRQTQLEAPSPQELRAKVEEAREPGRQSVRERIDAEATRLNARRSPRDRDKPKD